MGSYFWICLRLVIVSFECSSDVGMKLVWYEKRGVRGIGIVSVIVFWMSSSFVMKEVGNGGSNWRKI